MHVSHFPRPPVRRWCVQGHGALPLAGSGASTRQQRDIQVSHLIHGDQRGGGEWEWMVPPAWTEPDRLICSEQATHLCVSNSFWPSCDLGRTSPERLSILSRHVRQGSGGFCVRVSARRRLPDNKVRADHNKRQKVRVLSVPVNFTPSLTWKQPWRLYWKMLSFVVFFLSVAHFAHMCLL